ncbi:NAD(P)H-quinone oxidoreductase [Candidatus Liberibacter americanus]|uniref:Quinone oxidoreductase n=1 Tax=Candidatus Liberibacter americanus str. Sao Paulo TaxID=1261131 RepID=U6B5H0_9HYPH|nr:NAD(P)H-quinone oxidoreductase [Candidatus Liberibacter americanus]AHA28215.1 Quinone oxidoreductase [Candidatus Liberibacter americanus str. Sao Paulo]EMS36271.1 quinone oxidoreductase [Candidatus Liberibacter americanus PW_SP]
MITFKKMRCIALSHYGSTDVMYIKETTIPKPKNEDILIKVDAIGVNRPDIMQRKGLYPAPRNASPILGLEVAGKIVEIGKNVINWDIGDEVCALVNGGGYAEYCIAHQGQALRYPEGYDAIKSSAIPETFFTVWANLFQNEKRYEQKSVLVHGGSSGIGTTAIQLLSSFGAKVYTTARSKEKCIACLKLGAKYAVNYLEEDFVKAIQKHTKGKGIDIIFDMVGAKYFNRNINLLNKGGKLILISFLGGKNVKEFDLTPIMTQKLTITGSTLRRRTDLEKQLIRDELLLEVWPLLSSNHIKPIIHAVLPLEQASTAHNIMEKSENIGKIILTT